MLKAGKKNIALCGFMATGKSTIGRSLAKRLKLVFVDIDELIEKRADTSITEIFNKMGEAHFRQLESKALTEVAGHRNQVISCGGGAVLNQENVARLRADSLLVCLTATPQTILRRTQKSSNRPLLNTPDPMAAIRQLQAKRAGAYAACDYQVATDDKTIAELTSEIIALVCLES